VEGDWAVKNKKGHKQGCSQASQGGPGTQTESGESTHEEREGRAHKGNSGNRETMNIGSYRRRSTKGRNKTPREGLKPIGTDGERERTKYYTLRKILLGASGAGISRRLRRKVERRERRKKKYREREKKKPQLIN